MTKYGSRTQFNIAGEIGSKRPHKAHKPIENSQTTKSVLDVL